MPPKTPRRQQILEAFALMLQNHPGSRITTANLAKQVGVSEAALYRHFPSKAKMLEGLIEFAEDSLFSQINRILNEEHDAAQRCRQILFLLLKFSERNPGFTRLFVGDALQGETGRLRQRVRQIFDRIETQLRQVLREYQAHQPTTPAFSAAVVSSLLLASAEGRINQFVRSEFSITPTTGWEEQWNLLAKAVFVEDTAAT